MVQVTLTGEIDHPVVEADSAVCSLTRRANLPDVFVDRPLGHSVVFLLSNFVVTTRLNNPLVVELAVAVLILFNEAIKETGGVLVVSNLAVTIAVLAVEPVEGSGDVHLGEEGLQLVVPLDARVE